MNKQFPSLRELELTQRIVALDLQNARGNDTMNVFGKLREIASPITTQFYAISAAVGQMVSIRPTFFLSAKPQGEKLKNTNFSNFDSLSAQVPEGLAAKLSVYQDVLLTATEMYDNVIKNQLDPFIHFLEDVATNKTSLSSASKYSGVLKTHAVKREKLNSGIGACFKEGSFETTRKFSEVYLNKTDYLVAVAQTEKLNLWLGTISTKTVEAKVERICEVLDTLTDNVNNEIDLEVSKTNLKYLADCAYEVGREIEFFALLVYRIQAVSASMNANTTTIDKAM